MADTTPRRSADGWDVVFWLLVWPLALMRLIGRRAGWSASGSNVAGVVATVIFVVIVAYIGAMGSTTTTTTASRTTQSPTALSASPDDPSTVAMSTGTLPSEADTASWVSGALGNELEDTSANVTVKKTRCTHTDHETSKCSVYYRADGQDGKARVVVSVMQSYGLTLNVVSDEVQ